MRNNDKKAYLIGGGIASLSAAAYLIKDGGFEGKNIFIFEESNILGGSLDSKGDPKTGYLARGGRMFSEEVYNCTYDLFSFIPIRKWSSKTLLDDFKEFNEEFKIKAGARLVKEGKILDSSNFGLSIIDGLNMMKIIATPESFLFNSKISDHFSHSFFKTNFWFEWCTTFAFQPWHSAVEFKRYVLRFLQEFPRMNTMTGVKNTRYNQYDSVVLPLTDWLKEKGVNFLMESRVSSLEFVKRNNKKRVRTIIYSQKDKEIEVPIEEDDLVFFTNGSMTTNSTYGNTNSAPILNKEEPKDSWLLWKNISKGHREFGKPSVFDEKIDKTKWESFSVTLRNKKFFELMEKLSGNKPGTEEITTFKDSGWLLSIVIPPHPHFINQTDDVYVLWGYGLHPDRSGNYIHKKMSECTGEEIMFEICSHLNFIDDMPIIIKNMECIPCMMPYITSQFMPRKKDDRPPVIPKNTKNFAFIGQFCEIPDEISFTVEQSVRSAMIAVYSLLNIKKKIPPVYQGKYVPSVIEGCLKMIFSIEMRNLFCSKE